MEPAALPVKAAQDTANARRLKWLLRLGSSFAVCETNATLGLAWWSWEGVCSELPPDRLHVASVPANVTECQLKSAWRQGLD